MPRRPGLHGLRLPRRTAGARDFIRRQAEEEHALQEREDASERPGRERHQRRTRRARPRPLQETLSRSPAPRDRARRGGRQDEGDDFLDEPPRLERADRRGTVPGAVGRRAVLQGTQADLPNPRLRWIQRECRQVAGLDRDARAPPAAVHAPRRGLGAELLAPRGRRARGGVGQARPGRDPQNLWDSNTAQTG